MKKNDNYYFNKYHAVELALEDMNDLAEAIDGYCTMIPYSESAEEKDALQDQLDACLTMRDMLKAFGVSAETFKLVIVQVQNMIEKYEDIEFSNIEANDE